MLTTSSPHRFPRLALTRVVGIFVLLALVLGGATAGSHSAATLPAGAVAAQQAVPPPSTTVAAQQAVPPSTAILFRVDESGGVSGKCATKSE